MLHQHNKYDSNYYLLTRLFNEHVVKYWRMIAMCIGCMLIVSACTSINAYLLKPTLDKIFLEKNQSHLYILPAIIILLFISKGLANYYQSKTSKFLSQRILNDIQLRLYTHLIYADLSFLNEYPSGNILSRFTNDINALKKVIIDIMTNIMLDAFTVFGLLLVMFYQDAKLFAISLLGLPLVFLPLRILAKKMRRIVQSMQAEITDFTVRLDETFQNMRVIKSYCREEYEVRRASKVIDRFFALYHKSINVDSISSPLTEAVGGVTVALIILYAGMQVIAGDTTPGAFFSFMAALLMMYQPLKKLSNLNTSIQEGAAAAKRLFSMLDTDSIALTTQHLPKVQFKNYNISFKNVFFSYDAVGKNLNGVNLIIPEGKTVALVGSSGSGKSTIFSLLQRFYEADFGEITIDNYNIKNIHLHALRRQIAFVSQDVELFDDTIENNIRYGNLEANEEEVLDAAMAAAAHDFITNLPDGYRTQIGQHGAKLSGGQRQRIAIARAILKNAPILLLDEATSALDPISEKQVQMALEYLKKGRTTLVIAHRLSTIEKADLIYVVDNGQIKESGNHSSLLEIGGIYSKLYEQYRDNKC